MHVVAPSASQPCQPSRCIHCVLLLGSGCQLTDGAQGVNLGLADADVLAAALAAAVEGGTDVGDSDFLAVCGSSESCYRRTTSLCAGAVDMTLGFLVSNRCRTQPLQPAWHAIVMPP